MAVLEKISLALKAWEHHDNPSSSPSPYPLLFWRKGKKVDKTGEV
jgi:hypothetical protein